MKQLRSDSEQKAKPKRGRPPKETSLHKHMTAVTGARNKADMLHALEGLRADKRDEWVNASKWKANRGEVSVTMLAYLARLPDDDQLKMFDHFRRMGARFAKRYVECLTRPPTHEQLVERLLAFVVREYPTVDCGILAAALREVAAEVATER